MHIKSARIKKQIPLTLIFFCLSLLVVSQAMAARPEIVPLEGVSYNTAASWEDNLKTFIGRRVSLSLSSGKDLTGIIKDVGDHLVHLEKIEGKEFFDALVRVDNIIAVETKFRDYKR